jgi:excisionase family DNA binding protein
LKTELEPLDLELIAEKIAERLKPLISVNGKHDRGDALMTIDDAAAFLKTSKNQIYQWVNNSQHGLGDFPYLKAGKLLRFSKSAILKWLEAR